MVLISLIGGRVIPSFTRNWLVRKNPGRLPVPFGRFDVAVLAVSTLSLAVWVFTPWWLGTAVLMLEAHDPFHVSNQGHEHGAIHMLRRDRH